jgi:hypothetical protein
MDQLEKKLVSIENEPDESKHERSETVQNETGNCIHNEWTQ